MSVGLWARMVININDMVNIENLIRLATLVRDETANKQNTALRVGGTFLEVVYAIRYLLETVGELDTLAKGLDTRTRFFHGSSADVDALKNKTDLGVYVATATSWTGLLSVQFDFYSTVSQVALSSSTPDYSEGSLVWKPAPCIMWRTYTNGSWSAWAKAGGDVVNDLVTGGTDKALSAEQGKVLKEQLASLTSEMSRVKNAILTLLSSLGEYAFPSGKPTISWGGDTPTPTRVRITASLGAHVTPYSGPSSATLGSSLSVALSTTDNMYVIDPDSVVVTMGGSTVTSAAYNSTNDTITIANVTGDVTITANAMSYVGYGESNSSLVAMFDGKNRGGVSGAWQDMVDSSLQLAVTNCVEASDHVVLDGSTSTILASAAGVGVNVKRDDGTVEGVFSGMVMDSSHTSKSNIIMPNILRQDSGTTVSLLSLGLFYSPDNFSNIGVFWYNQTGGSDSNPKIWKIGKTSIATSDNLHLSVNSERGYCNGTQLVRATTPQGTGFCLASTYSRLGIFSNVTSAGATSYKQGTVYCLRIYNTKLTDAQILRNYLVDKKRFKLA